MTVDIICEYLAIGVLVAGTGYVALIVIGGLGLIGWYLVETALEEWRRSRADIGETQ